MRIEQQTLPNAPRLAWSATVIPNDETVRVLAGKDVLHDGAVFWEGLNLSPNHPGAALEHPFPLSTGGVAGADDVAFWTPGHILDRLFVVECDGHIVVSNSLPFALRTAGTSLVPDSLHYPWHLGHIKAHCQSAPLTRGRLRIVSNANVSIARSGVIEVSAKRVPPAFDSYGAYLSQLHALMDEVGEANRQATGGAYRYIATLSSGYDSTAATVLGKRIGLSDAISIVDSRGGGIGDDSGEALASVMGLSVKTGRRTDYQAAGWDAERLFYVFGLPEDIYMYPFREHLNRTLLFTGIQGDQMWNRERGTSLGSTWSWDPGGCTMQEFRLRTGFVHLPPAAFGWQHTERLRSIARSAELQPWSLDNDYDRPVPRRIAEEAGVPRELFGMKKKAVSITMGIDHLDYLGTDALGVSPAMMQRLAEYAKSVAGLKCRTEMALCSVLHEVVRVLHRKTVHLKTDEKPRADAEAPRNKAWKMIVDADRILPVRRKYMAPFSILNFSTQIANASLAEDYAAS